MSFRASSALLSVVFVALAFSIATADRAVIVVAGAKGGELDVVTNAAREVIERGTWQVVDHKLPPERIAEVMKCSADHNSECIGSVLDEVGADRLVSFKLSDDKYKNKPVRLVVVTILRRGADVLASGQRYCEACRDDLLADHVRSVLTGVLRDARRTLNPATLVVRSVPARALVKLDGQPIGPTEIRRTIDPGTHTLEVRAEGHRPFSKEITIGDGERKEIDAELVPLTGVSHNEERRPVGGDKSRSLAPWLVVGGGGLLAIGGSVLLWVDEDDTSNGRRVPEYRDTALGGGVLVATGLATATVGLIWWWRERSSRDDGTHPTVTFTDGGARIGFAGSF